MSGTSQGQVDPSDTASELNAQVFMVQQMLGRISTMKIVQVVSVTAANNGDPVPAGSVSVRPLVNQIDGAGNATPHGIVNGLPYFRYQGGTNALIMDPVAGDIGLAVVADRDISSVKANFGQANPGSYRKFNLADGVYLGGILSNVAPVQFVTFLPNGIKISDVNGNVILMQPGSVAISSAKLTHNGANVGSTHVHTDPQGGMTGGPQ
jgi:hypothetical protein